VGLLVLQAGGGIVYIGSERIQAPRPPSKGRNMETLPDTWTDTVRNCLLEVWGRQACQRPADWPEVRERLLTTLAPLVDTAAAELARLFDGRSLDDPAIAVWRSFPRLDRNHCAKLATLLVDASGQNLTVESD
jgi:hypothetical protein